MVEVVRSNDRISPSPDVSSSRKAKSHSLFSFKACVLSAYGNSPFLPHSLSSSIRITI